MLRIGVIESVHVANALREYDGDEEAGDGEEKKAPTPGSLVWTARTSIVLQLVSVFDEGVQEYLDKNRPTQRCDRLRAASNS